MIRKQVYIQKKQDEKLKEISRQLGVTEAEVIRRGIDLVAARQERQSADEAWKKALALMDRVAAESSKEPEGERTWKREEVYDERPKYLSG
jgi:hypothetical protein